MKRFLYQSLGAKLLMGKLITFTILCIAGFNSASGQSFTRKSAIKEITWLENNPLHKDYNARFVNILGWLGMNGITKSNLAVLNDLDLKDYKYERQIQMIYMFSFMAYEVEYKEYKDFEGSVRAVEGINRTYKAILKSDPDATNEDLSKLIEYQDDGSLNDYIIEKLEK